MSLILGIYCKKDSICDKKIEKVLREFSLDNRRMLQTVRDKKILLSFSKSKIDSNNIVENENKSLIILFGGRVYDFHNRVDNLIARGHKFKCRKNSTEFMLHSFEEHEESFLKEISGIFGFAIYDRLNDELIIGNDSFGFYPLFIYNDDEYAIFSSEYEPITRYKKFDKKLNYDAIAEYFALGIPLGDKTFFKNISNLHPGSVLRIRKNKINFGQYDDLNIKINKYRDINFFSEEVSKLICNAAQARIKDPKRIRCTLTGGADSRLILGNLTKRQRESVTFVTYASPWLDTDKNQEVVIAEMLAKRFNLRHIIKKNIPKRIKDFGVSFFKRRNDRIYNKRVLTGVGGGEFLGGDCFTTFPVNCEEINKKEIDIKLKRVFSKKFLENISNPYFSLKKIIREINAENKELLFYIHQFTRGFFTSRFGGSGAGWLTPYKFAIRFDSIFLDKNLLKFLLTVPKRFIKNRMLYDQMYKNHFSHLIEVPTTRKTLNPITWGENPHYARKKRHVRALSAYIKSHHTYDKQFYNVKYIKSIAKEKDHPTTLQLVNFEAWYRAFLC